MAGQGKGSGDLDDEVGGDEGGLLLPAAVDEPGGGDHDEARAEDGVGEVGSEHRPHHLTRHRCSAHGLVPVPDRKRREGKEGSLASWTLTQMARENSNAASTSSRIPINFPPVYIPASFKQRVTWTAIVGRTLTWQQLQQQRHRPGLDSQLLLIFPCADSDKQRSV